MHQRKSILTAGRAVRKDQPFLEALLSGQPALADSPVVFSEVERIRQIPRYAFESPLHGTCRTPQGLACTVQVRALHMDSHGADLAGLEALGLEAVMAGLNLDLELELPRVGQLTLRARTYAEATSLQGPVETPAAVPVRFEFMPEADRMRINRFLLQPREGAPALPSTEQRRYRRFVRSVPVDFQVLGASVASASSCSGQMITLDASAGGLKIRTTHDLKVHDHLYVRLQLEGQSFFSLAEVVWVMPSRLLGHNLAGLSFVNLPAPEQMRLQTLLAR